MDSFKLGIAVVLALAAGGVGGAYLADNRVGPELAGLAAARDDALAAESKAKEQAEARRIEVARLSAQNQALRDQVDTLRDAALTQPAASLPPATPAVPSMVEEEAPNLASLLSTMNPRPEGLRPDRQPDSEPSDLTPQQAEERRQRRAEFTTQMRERNREFMTAELQKTTDPTARQRLESITEYSDYLMDLMQQVREAPEDQRATLQQEFDQTRETVGGLLKEQQDYMLRQVAAQQGIADPARQQAFVDALREAQSSPLFRAPTLTWGGPSIVAQRGGELGTAARP